MHDEVPMPRGIPRSWVLTARQRGRRWVIVHVTMLRILLPIFAARALYSHWADGSLLQGGAAEPILMDLVRAVVKVPFLGWILGGVLCNILGLPYRSEARAPAFAPAAPSFVDRGRAAIGLPPLTPPGTGRHREGVSPAVFDVEQRDPPSS